jgi:ubiquinone/menaquinone biosynthesis C-methylase UbiE
MSSLALMRWLEATPDRYDAGMRAITLGRVDALHDAVAAAAAPAPGCEVLEVGCGTGAVTLRLLARGARVTALDQSAEMLEQARRRVAAWMDETQATPGSAPGWLERSAAEIDALPREAFDSVVLSLSLSEMSAEGRRYVLARARERLRPGGRVVAADEVRARGGAARILQALVRAPQWLLGWLLAGSVSRPLADLRGELEAAGLVVRREQRWLAGTLALYVAEDEA